MIWWKRVADWWIGLELFNTDIYRTLKFVFGVVMWLIAKGALYLFGGVLSIAVFIFMAGFPLMWLWNDCVPALTKGALAPISFWQSLEIMVLSVILFKRSGDCECKCQENHTDE